MRKKLLCVTTFVCLSALFTGSLSAETTDRGIIDGFLKEGDRQRSKKEFVAALENYSRAFLLDPQRQEARDKLLSLTDAATISVVQKADLLKLKESISALNNLSLKVTYFEDKLGEFLLELSSRGWDKEQLYVEMKRIEEENKPQSLVPSAGSYLQRRDPLGMILASMDEKKSELSARQALRALQFERLRELSKARLDQDEVVLTADRIGDRGMTRPSTFIGAQRPVDSPNNQEVVELSLQLTEAQQKMGDKDRQIGGLNAQLQRLMEQIKFNEKLIKEKNDELVALNEQLADFQGQLRLRQKLAQDEQESADQVEPDLDQSGLLAENEQLKSTLSAKQRENAQLERLLALSDERNLALQKGINRQATGGFRWFWEKPVQDRAGNRGMELLTANKFKELVKERDRAILQKDEQITELKGVLGIYQDLLKEAKSSLALANQNTQNLQQEAVQIKGQLTQKSQVVLDAEYNLMSLKKELTSVQTRLIALRNLPETKNYGKMESEMHDLEDKMNNIHKFLLKQLDDFERLNKEYIAGDIEDMDKVLNLNIDRIERK